MSNNCHIIKHVPLFQILSTSDSEELLLLAREIPLAEFSVHGAMGQCQICDDDDDFFGAKQTEKAVSGIKLWRVVRIGGGVPTLKCLKGKPVKTRAGVLAEMFMEMARKNLNRLVQQIRDYGVSFAKVDSMAPVPDDIKELSEA